MTRRSLVVWLLVISFAPALSSAVLAQPPAPPMEAELFPEAVKIRAPEPPEPDVYDASAAVVTVLKAPFNVALCAIGVGVGAGLFAVTLGTGLRAAAWAVEEGCARRWVVTGDDLRPDGPRGRLP
jgi:hypothetical protein